jgi:hypothetical protein
MEYEYYYNNVPGKGLCRNNLIYTSLISTDKKVFVKWYHNDTEYHQGKNQVVDPDKMDEKWHREVKYLTAMSKTFPDLIPQILDIDEINRKIYLKIDGPDFWEQAGCNSANFDNVLPDWRDQMFAIVWAHKCLGLHKYSMHPSSYFVVDGKLKSINYFFTYHKNENLINIADHQSHLSEDRKKELQQYTDKQGISWTDPQPFELLEKLCWKSFSNMYPRDFIEKALCIK